MDEATSMAQKLAGVSRPAMAETKRLFHEVSDLPLAELVPSAQKEKPYLGPYPIMNTALNLNAGSELATQERKATSFVFTPR